MSYQILNDLRKNITLGLYTSQNGKCYYCQDQMGAFNEANVTDQADNLPTYDHKILKANGGTNTQSNGVCACLLCNRVRGSMSFESFKTIVVDTSSRDAMIKLKASMPLHKWHQLYPFCSDGNSDSISEARIQKRNSAYQNTTAAKKQRAIVKANELLVVLKHKSDMLSNQQGRCACCNDFTLDIGRTYDDMTESEYLQHTKRPLQRGAVIVCSTCYIGEVVKPANNMLTFLRNLL